MKKPMINGKTKLELTWIGEENRPRLEPRCTFYPSCSSYFMEAVQKKGVIKGCALGVWRLLRCQPFCRGGYDPVKLMRPLIGCGPMATLHILLESAARREYD